MDLAKEKTSVEKENNTQGAANAEKRSTKILFVLVDGLGDVCYPHKGNRTVLQYMDCPTLDSVAKYGANGLMDPFEQGYSCGSDTAHLSIFGYSPLKYYKGRGAFETEGAGIPMIPGDIAFKCNFATMNKETGIVEKRRVDRNFDKWGLDLIDYLNGMSIPGYENYSVTIKHATEHRVGLKVSGPGLSNEITDTDPLTDNNLLKVPEATTPKGELTAKIVCFVYRRLKLFRTK